MPLRTLSPVLWIAFFLILLEVGLEWRASQRGWGTLIFGEEHAGEAAEATRDFGPTDDFPFRSHIVARERDPLQRRLWIASSSYAEDKRLAASTVFPNRLEALLREAGLAVQVLNASRNGYTTASNLDVLREIGADWRPDVCLLYQMTNDIDWITNAILSPGADPELALGPDSQPGAGSAGTPPPRGWIEGKSEETTVFSVLKSNLTSRLSAARILLDRLPARADAAFEAYVRTFVDEARSLGARPVLCTFATRNTQATRATLPTEVVLALRRVNLYLSIDGWLDAVARFNAVLRRVALEEGLPLLDVAAALADQPELFRDFSHLYEGGHELVARTLFEGLQALPELQPRGPSNGRGH